MTGPVVDVARLRSLLDAAPPTLLPMMKGAGQAADDVPICDSAGDYICASPDDGVRGGHDPEVADEVDSWMEHRGQSTAFALRLRAALATEAGEPDA